MLSIRLKETEFIFRAEDVTNYKPLIAIAVTHM
jgi:hypothetical protein